MTCPVRRTARALALATLALCTTAACTARPGPMAQPAVVSTDASDPATAVARLLADADAAQGDPRRLGALIAAMDRLGARPLDAAADPVARWRSAALAPQTPPYRGRVLGPAYKAGMIDPGGTVRLPQLFDGGRAARVAVATPGQAGLEFTVLDGEAKPVCPPAKARNRQCTWTPLYSGRFESVLENSSSNAAGYYLVID